MHRAAVSLALTLVLAGAGATGAQDRGAAALHQQVSGLTVTARVLVVGAHPDDADAELLAWLARGKHVQTAYLSVTRGEGAPNTLSGGSGSVLGAIRVQETMNARRIDGAEQYFTRSYDFGYARDSNGVFQKWNRDSVVGDIVTVIRSFRPHVIISSHTDSAAGEMQHVVLSPTVLTAYHAASDTARYPARQFGYPWAPAKLYRAGGSLRLDLTARDPVIGATYAEIGRDSRAQHRSQGLADVIAFRRSTSLAFQASNGPENLSDSGLFAGLDTTFARLRIDAPAPVAALLDSLGAHADTARAVLDLAQPDSAVRHLARVASLAGAVRLETAWCRHPAPIVDLPPEPPVTCGHRELDLDASIDVVRQRSVAALLAAAGVAIEQHAGQELLAASDTGWISVGVTNHGHFPVTVEQVFHPSAIDPPDAAVAVPPGEGRRVQRRVADLSDGQPWWIRTLKEWRFPDIPTSLEGQALGVMFRANPLAAPSVAIPEHLRQTSGIRLTLTVAGATVETRLGDDVVPYADRNVGYQRRALTGVPDVTLRLGRSLEWIPAGKRVTHFLRVELQNHTDRRQVLRLGFVTPNGVRIDSAPSQVTLEPREQRDLFLRMRSTMPAGDKEIFGITVRRVGHDPIITGYHVIEHSHLRPIRIARQSGMWLQPVDVVVPRTLAAVYVPGTSDDVHLALRDIGVSLAVVGAEDFHQVNLSQITTVVFGPRALETHRVLLTQMPRLMDWVRAGGTLVIQRGDQFTVHSSALPFPAVLRAPVPDRVASADAPVSMIFPNARLLKWPNVIRASDWSGWVSGRTTAVPAVADERWVRFIEVHDQGQRESRNALLLAQLGKGVVIYSALTLDEQISGGVPGALRLLVNLMSASLTETPTSRIAR